MKYGKICGACQGRAKCRNKPTAAMPIRMECVACAGKGCVQCNDAGTVDITACPLESIGNEIYDLLDYISLFYAGIPPVSGGSLDQSASFLGAAEFVKAEHSRFGGDMRQWERMM